MLQSARDEYDGKGGVYIYLLLLRPRLNVKKKTTPVAQNSHLVCIQTECTKKKSVSGHVAVFC